MTAAASDAANGAGGPTAPTDPSPTDALTGDPTGDPTGESRTATGDPGSIRLRVAVMNDYDLVVQGLRRMLEPFADRIEVVELDCRLPVQEEVDVLLYDTYSREQVTGPVLEVLERCRARVLLYTWHLDPHTVASCLRAGAAGCVSKSVGAEDLVGALEKAATGSVVVSPDPGPDAAVSSGDWPGRDVGLTARESELLALIAQGLTNVEVAERAYISVNSLKTHIRSVYRKIGAERRSQALLWATRHGFAPDTYRVVL